MIQIPNILLLHEGFLEHLSQRVESWNEEKTIGDWFLDCVSWINYESYQRLTCSLYKRA